MSGVISAFAVVLLLVVLSWLHQMYLRQMPIEVRGLLISIAAIVGLILLSLVGIMATSFGELALILFAIFASWVLIKRYWRNLIDLAWMGVPLGALIIDWTNGNLVDLPSDLDIPADSERTCFLVGLALFTGAMLVNISIIGWSVIQHVRNRTVLQMIRSNWYYVFGVATAVWLSIGLDSSAGLDTQINLFDTWIMYIIIAMFFIGIGWGIDVLVRWLSKWITSEQKEN